VAALSVLFRAGGSQYLRGISESKATGLGAIVGWLSEGVMTFGLAALVVSEIAAVVLLARSFSRDHSLRRFFSVLSMGCAVFVVALLGLLLWLLRYSPSFSR
jgi:hypothetical protein